MPEVSSRRRALAGLFALVLIVLFTAGSFARPSDEPAPVAQRIEVATFRQAGQAPIVVGLPDTWTRRGADIGQPGTYTVEFMLDELPHESLALSFHRLSTRHRVHVNGYLASAEGEGPNRSNAGLPAPALILLPVSILRTGRNEVAIEVRHLNRAGLSAIELGEAAALRERHKRDRLTDVELPQALNMACLGVSMLMILIWWRRRSEVALGSFGLLGLMGSARNYSYYAVTTVGPMTIADWFFFAAQVWTVVLLTVFAQAFAKVRWRRYTRVLIGLAVATSAIGFVAATQGRLQELRHLVYPPMLLACTPALWLCMRRAQAQPAWSAGLQVAGVLGMLGAAVHDYALQTAGWLPITDSFWMPFAMPMAIAAMGWVLMRRLVDAMGEVEALSTKLEARVAERTHELEIANAAKTRFLASASHDLRQPLVTIGLLVGMARENSESAQTRRIMERADEAVGAMESLLTGLLDLSRLEAGAVQPRPQPVRLADIFAAIEAHEHAAAEQKALRLRVRPSSLVVHSDPVMLEQILRNLVGNAIRYTERGSVLLAARRRRGLVRIEVRDSGIGIAAENQQAIFEEFVQVDNPARHRTRGMGLGLAIVQRSAAKLRHPLGLSSAVGRGSCFWIDVPPALAPVPVLAAAPAPRHLAGVHIVLVEDDGPVRDALSERLRSWGAKVDPFAGLPAMLDWLANAGTAPDLLVTDYRLPEGDGLQAVQAMRARFAEVRAVVVTGDTAPHDIARLHAAGVRVLHKPFRAEALLEELRERA